MWGDVSVANHAVAWENLSLIIHSPVHLALHAGYFSWHWHGVLIRKYINNCGFKINILFFTEKKKS